VRSRSPWVPALFFCNHQSCLLVAQINGVIKGTRGAPQGDFSHCVAGTISLYCSRYEVLMTGPALSQGTGVQTLLQDFSRHRLHLTAGPSTPKQKYQGMARGPLPTQNGLNEREWIGSYVSCQGTHVREKTMQVARHIRCIVLRSSTEVASHRRERSGAALWHGLCNMGIVSAYFFHAQSVRLSLPHVNRDMRLAHHVPPPVQPGTPAHPLTNAVSQKLSRSDLVQLSIVFHLPSAKAEAIYRYVTRSLFTRRVYLVYSELTNWR
jgi:hypothetical protein